MKHLARGVAAQRGVLTAITSGLQFGRLVLSPLSAPPVAARIRTENRQTPTKGKESNMTEATKPSGSFVLWQNTLCNPLADPIVMTHSAWHDGYASGVKAEREACAKLCEAEGRRIDASWSSCAAAIRNKSN